MITVIIPVYNSEETIENCINSILGQVYSDFEIILVDDGSVDKSPDICQQYALSYRNIAFISHESNRGISSARNTGLDAASGDWITFCDNDDIVSPYWLEHLYSSIQGDNNVLPICSFTKYKGELGNRRILTLDAGIYYQISYYLSFYEHGIAGYVWNSLYKKDIINHYKIRFPERKELGDINEDLIFQLDYIRHVSSLTYTGYNDYLWCVSESNHSQETTTKFYFKKYEEKYNLLRSWIHYCRVDIDGMMKRMASMMLYHFIHAICIETDYNKFVHYIKSQSVHDCIVYADCSKENSTIIRLLKKNHPFFLWYYLKLFKFKKLKRI